MTDNFWYNNINILYNKDNILEIIPLREYNFNRKLNSLVRLSIIYSIISYLITNNNNVICIPFIVIIITVFLYKNKNKNNKVENSNKNGINNLVNTKLLNSNILEQSNLLNNVLSSANGNNDDLNNNLYENIPIVDNIINKIKNSSCSLPTTDNPFMNLNPYEFSDGTKSDSCKSYNNLRIQNMIENKFNEDLYIDSNDLFNRRNSQRQFYTMPNNLIPNNQTDFAKSLYNIGDRDRNKFYI